MIKTGKITHYNLNMKFKVSLKKNNKTQTLPLQKNLFYYSGIVKNRIITQQRKISG